MYSFWQRKTKAITAIENPEKILALLTKKEGDHRSREYQKEAKCYNIKERGKVFRNHQSHKPNFDKAYTADKPIIERSLFNDQVPLCRRE